jgi:glyoxylase I family protein
MTSAAQNSQVASPQRIHHVRLTVTDIDRSKGVYSGVFGIEPQMDFSAQSSDPQVRADPSRMFGGCMFEIGEQILGLRPVAQVGDRFDSVRVGLDHISLAVDSVDDLHVAAGRLEELGVSHGDVIELADFGLAILSLQDPDDINLELVAELPSDDE